MPIVKAYGLFERVANRKYQQISDKAYPKPIAIRVFQTQLLDGFFSGKHLSLRPIKNIKVSQDPMNLCVPCSTNQHNNHIKYFGCKCNCLMFVKVN